MNLSVCIVNLNSLEYLKRCIGSLAKGIKDNTFEVIVVDNNSKDNSILYLKKFGKFKMSIIKNKFNIGYTKAINQAIKKSLGEYILVLNPDSILEDKSIDKIIEYFKSNKKIGIVGPKVVDKYNHLKHKSYLAPLLF